jgi:hypothetical protein
MTTARSRRPVDSTTNTCEVRNADGEFLACDGGWDTRPDVPSAAWLDFHRFGRIEAERLAALHSGSFLVSRGTGNC